MIPVGQNRLRQSKKKQRQLATGLHPYYPGQRLTAADGDAGAGQGAQTDEGQAGVHIHAGHLG